MPKDQHRPNGPMPKPRRNLADKIYRPVGEAEQLAARPSTYPTTLSVGNCWVNTRHVIAVDVTDENTIVFHLDTGRVLDTGAIAEPRALEEIIRTLNWR